LGEGRGYRKGSHGSTNISDIKRETKGGAPRLEYLDGLRGAAALYVVLFHAAAGFTSNDLPIWARTLRHATTFGHSAVAVFIVLSGYCLMLPAARAGGHLTRGVGDYLTRRARRILPPYYATVFVSLLLLKVVPELSVRSGTIWDESFPAFEAGPIATHLLLVHNLFPAWVYKINGPLWSVATEWQIYFFFPLLLLPLWRRAGLVATLAVAFALGCAPIWFAPSIASKAIPWYLGLFALGMCAAGIGFSERPFERRLLDGVPWKIVLGVLVACCLVGTTLLIHKWFVWMPASDTLVGAATAAALVAYTRDATRAVGRLPLMLRAFDSPLMVGVGRFSYSLYLTHLPVVAMCYLVLKRFGLAPAIEMLVMIVVSFPISLAAAYGFYRVFERRFVNRPAVLALKPS
jgi:peptidoglycan/LPS O-acetylase OafA/YrhL